MAGEEKQVNCEMAMHISFPLGAVFISIHTSQTNLQVGGEGFG